MDEAPLPLAFVNSVWGWAVILFIGLLLFGSRLPSVARNMGKGINEFKKGLNEGLSDDDRGRDHGPSPGGSGGAAGSSSGANAQNAPSAQNAKKTDIEETSV